jgi:hypothetical protein
VSDVTGPRSLTGPERAIDSAYIHVTVPDGTVARPSATPHADDSAPAEEAGHPRGARPAPAEDPTGLAADDRFPNSGAAVPNGHPVPDDDDDPYGGAVSTNGTASTGGTASTVSTGGTALDGAAGLNGVAGPNGANGPNGGTGPHGAVVPRRYDTGPRLPAPFDPAASFEETPPASEQQYAGGVLETTGPRSLAPHSTGEPPPSGPYWPATPSDQRTPAGQWEEQPFSGIGRGDLRELAGRLEQLDQLLSRLEEAKRQAADASEHLALTRRWQEETVRTIQEERARMRQRQHALDELADRARAAVKAMQATYRTLPREVIELAIELHVLDRAGFVTRRPSRPKPDDLT